MLAPQTTENPIFWHITGASPAQIKAAADQSVEAGFEMMILTFFTGFNILNTDPGYVSSMKEAFAYAHGKGIEVGGYWLVSSSADGGAANNVVNPLTGKVESPEYGQSACLASRYKEDVLDDKVKTFMATTGMDVIETDGPYHGDHCASTIHPHHKGLDDSRVSQHRILTDWYHEMVGKGIYINTPDSYMFNGAHKLPVGYSEESWSLPHWRQILAGRQFLFDGTFKRTPPMSWTFTPLEEYHGGGAEATVEPLSQNLKVYEWHLAQNFGSGVQSSWRGSRLFDGPETKALVRKWVDFFKRYRTLLNADIIHLKRPEPQPGNPDFTADLDYMMHVDPSGRRALLMVYNQTAQTREKTLSIPLYYSGIRGQVRVREQEGAAETRLCDSQGNVSVTVALASRSVTWFYLDQGTQTGIPGARLSGSRRGQVDRYDVDGRRARPGQGVHLPGK